MTAPHTSTGPVIVFDGHCVLCSANTRFVLRNDRAGRFRLAAMQGEAGRALFEAAGVDPDDPETLVVVEGARIHYDSDAVIRIWSGLGWPWKALGLARIVPRALRDPVYRLMARNRYRWFGRHEECFVPDPQWTDRIL